MTEPTTKTTIRLVLVTGMSGSGKSVALTALEDVGFYCVDNLPPELLEAFISLEQGMRANQVAIAMDVRSAKSLPSLPLRLAKLEQEHHRNLHLTTVFLDATTDTLVRRFSETRRLHPLSLKGAGDQHRALTDAIEHERELLAELRDQALVIDTSLIRPAQLRSQIKALLGAMPAPLTLVFESFAFKRGVPMHADFVFDVRMLPNPHYEPELKALTGRDPAVADFLRAQPEVQRMREQLIAFLRDWLPQMLNDHRSYVTVAVGCTGGQHRSVFLVEELTKAFSGEWATRMRHREIDDWPARTKRAGDLG